VTWAATHRRPLSNEPMFLLLFGGLGLYGGDDDFFLFIQRMHQHLNSSFVIIGAEEAARLARELHTRRTGLNTAVDHSHTP
jgi:hypothetical protein